MGRRSSPTIIAVNLYAGGHHPQHLEALLAHWIDMDGDGALHFVVSDTYRERHPALLAAFDAASNVQRHLVPVSNLPTNRRRELLSSDRRHGRVVTEWATRLHADHVLLMYFDHAQLSLARTLRFTWPLSISGIYFRPTFHYRDLGIDRGWRERVAAARKQAVLRAALRNPHLRYVFCFDHLAVERFPGSSHVEAVSLPEAFREGARSTAESPITLGLDPGRRRLLLFGSLDERKGISPVLDALSGLSQTDQSRLALVLAGPVSGPRRAELLERIHRFRSSSNVQVAFDDRYLDEDEIQPLFRGCDLVLLTYVHHVGSSGILVRAAHAEVPVLSTDYGLLGAQVKQSRLGTTLDSTSAPAIRSMLMRWLADPSSLGFDPAGARAYAAANTSQAFAETIFSRLLRPRE